MRVLAGGGRRRILLATACLAGGLGLVTVALVLATFLAAVVEVVEALTEVAA